MATLSLSHIYKRYSNGFEAVQDFNLEVADKEFIALVGPSGCGKSTTLRMIAGLEDISDGEFYIDDRMVNHVEPKDRDIAMVFQSYALYPHMSVYDNMAFALKLRKISKEEIDRKVKEAAAIDCRSRSKRFWTITFPLLAPTTFFLLVINITYAFFDTFGIIDTLTRGRPSGETSTLVYKIYQDGFIGADLGGSSAQSVILMVFVMLLTVIQFRFLEKKIHY